MTPADMWSKLILLAGLVASPAIAGPLQERGLDVCSSGIFGELSALRNYAIAQEFCKAVRGLWILTINDVC